jgi:threonine synthase
VDRSVTPEDNSRAGGRLSAGYAVRQSGGTVIAISDSDVIDAVAKLASEEGIFASREGVACVAAEERHLGSGFLKSDDQMVICNTGSG